MFGQLVPVNGGETIPLFSEHLTVGRRGECDITLLFSNVSGRHAELILRDGYWFVKDLNSSNGTKVNDRRISEAYVEPGSVVMFAKNPYRLEYSPEENGATGPAPSSAVQKSVSRRVELSVGDDIEATIFGQSLLERAGLSRGFKPKKQDPEDEDKRYKLD